MADVKPLGRRLIIKWSKTVSHVLAVGTLSAVIVIAGRLFNGTEDIKVWEVTIPLELAWVFFLCLTVVHIFSGLFLCKHAADFQRSDANYEERLDTYHDVLDEGGHYLSVTIRRIPVKGHTIVRNVSG